MYLNAKDTMDVLTVLPGRASHKGIMRAPAAVQRAQRACRCHCMGRKQTLRNATKSCGPGQPLFLICAIRSWGKRLVRAQGQYCMVSLPLPNCTPVIPAHCWKSCMWVPGQSISTACGDGLINGEQLHKSPKTFHVVEEELTLGGKCLLKKLTQKDQHPKSKHTH